MYRYVKRYDDRVARGNTLTINLHLYFDDDCNPAIPAGAYQKEDDESWYLDVPGKFVICDRCNGHGTHMNPSIDGNGITSDEWEEWDDDAREGYFSGRYDVRCEARCNNGKIMVPDIDRLSPELQKVIEEWENNEYERDCENAADARTRWYEDGCPRD